MGSSSVMANRFGTQRIFRNLKRASPTVPRPHRARSGGPRIDIFLRRRRLRDRQRTRPDSSWAETLCAASFAALALGFFAREFAGSASSITAVLPASFACVALLGIWTSRLPTAQKILWSIPALAFLVPFLPAS